MAVEGSDSWLQVGAAAILTVWTGVTGHLYARIGTVERLAATKTELDKAIQTFNDIQKQDREDHQKLMDKLDRQSETLNKLVGRLESAFPHEVR